MLLISRSDILTVTTIDPRRDLKVSPRRGAHVLIHGDSGSMSFAPGFGLLLTSPPYYHPQRLSNAHGDAYVGETSNYVERISDVLIRCARSVKNRRVCFVKTDIWYRGNLIPIGFELARSCVRKGLRLQAHWIWKRTSAYSPYSPSFSNIFLFSDQLMRLQRPGVLELSHKRRRGIPSSFTPELFAELVLLFSDKNDVILDPFAGVGAATHAAIAAGRGSVGIESSAEQLARAQVMLKGMVNAQDRRIKKKGK